MIVVIYKIKRNVKLNITGIHIELVLKNTMVTSLPIERKVHPPPCRYKSTGLLGR